MDHKQMRTIESSENINQQISELAYQSWQKDGCHHGHDLDHWLQAESQIKATRNILVAEAPITTIEKPKPFKSKSNGSRKTPSVRKPRSDSF